MVFPIVTRRKRVSLARGFYPGLLTAAAAALIASPLVAAPSHSVEVVNAATGAISSYPTIQAGINAAQPQDTVIVEPGVYRETVTIPPGKDDLTVRSAQGAASTYIVGDIALDLQPNIHAVVSINANGVTFGGPDTGFTIANAPHNGVTSVPVARGIAVGAGSGNSNVRVLGNHVEDLLPQGVTLPTGGRIYGITANSCPNITIADNEIGPLSARLQPGATNARVEGLLFFSAPSRYNSGRVLRNRVHDLESRGGATGSGAPGTDTNGVIGLKIDDNTQQTTLTGNEIVRLHSDNGAAGISTDAIPGPIEINHNRIADIRGAAQQSMGVWLQPLGPTTETVMENQIQHTGIAVAVTQPLGPDSAVEYNNFLQDQVGVYNSAEPALNATNDYWGCPDGPMGNNGDCARVVDVPPGHTNYQPVLHSPAHLAARSSAPSGGDADGQGRGDRD